MNSVEKKGGNIAAIATMFALFFMIAFVTNIAGNMGPVVKSQFGASNTASQFGSAANFLAYLFMGIPGGLILRRKGYKFTSLLAVGIGIIGLSIQLASGFAESFAVYVTGAFIAGFSMCLLNLVVNPLLNTLGGEGKKGNQLVQFGCSLNSVGATLAPYFVGVLVADITKAKVADVAPVLWTAIGIFVAAFIVIALSKIPEPHMETAEEKSARLSGGSSVFKDIVETLKFKHFTFGALGIFFYIIIESGIPNFAQLYMTDVKEVNGSQTPITAVEAAQITGEAVARDKQKAGEIEAVDKLLKANAIEKKAAKEQKKEIEKRYERKPGDEFAVVKVKNDKGEFEKFDISKGVPVAADAAGEFVKVTNRVSDSYVGAAAAGVLIGLYWLCMMIGRFLGGVIGGKISSKVMVTCCSLAGIALLLATMFTPLKIVTVCGNTFPMAMCFMSLCGLCTSVMWGAIFNLAAEGLGKYVPMGSGIFMAMVFGGACLPFQGFIADKFGYLNSYWLTIGLFAYVLLYAFVLSKPTKRAE